MSWKETIWRSKASLFMTNCTINLEEVMTALVTNSTQLKASTTEINKSCQVGPHSFDKKHFILKISDGRRLVTQQPNKCLILFTLAMDPKQKSSHVVLASFRIILNISLEMTTGWIECIHEKYEKPG